MFAYIFLAEVSPAEILDVSYPKNAVVCDNATLVCQVRPSKAHVWWNAAGKNFTESDTR